MSPANIEVSELSAGGDNVGSTEPTRKLLGLDPESRSPLLAGKAGLLALTGTKSYVPRLGGFKEKPKETIFEAPRAQMQFTANDVTVGKLDWRHWLVKGFPTAGICSSRRSWPSRACHRRPPRDPTVFSPSSATRSNT